MESKERLEIIQSFLSKTPVRGKRLPIGNYLGWVLSRIYLLPLDLKLKRHYLRVQDDYLIFCKNKKNQKKFETENEISKIIKISKNIDEIKLYSVVKELEEVNKK